MYHIRITLQGQTRLQKAQMQNHAKPPKPHETTRNYAKLRETTQNNAKTRKKTQNHAKSRGIMQNHAKPCKTMQTTPTYYWEHVETF